MSIYLLYVDSILYFFPPPSGKKWRGGNVFAGSISNVTSWLCLHHSSDQQQCSGEIEKHRPFYSHFVAADQSRLKQEGGS